MLRSCWIFAPILTAMVVLSSAHRAQGQTVSTAPTAPTVPATVKSQAAVLPPVPAGVTDLKFSEFFVTPVGRYGLEATPKLRSLNGKRVRLVGFMVRRGEPVPGVFLLAPMPVVIDEHEGGYADLPPNTVRVELPWAQKKMIPYIQGAATYIGVLQVGNREEKDGSVSAFRLILDKPESPPSASPSKPKSPDTSKVPER